MARRDDCDDGAFRIDGAELWVVHLTWRAETDALWPDAMRIETRERRDGDDDPRDSNDV